MEAKSTLKAFSKSTVEKLMEPVEAQGRLSGFVHESYWKRKIPHGIALTAAHRRLMHQHPEIYLMTKFAVYRSSGVGLGVNYPMKNLTWRCLILIVFHQLSSGRYSAICGVSKSWTLHSTTLSRTLSVTR
jgi:hypothetical protein